jgi:DNA-binding beta-propeller fold protein YncE
VDATNNKVYFSARNNHVVSVADVAQNKITAVYGTFGTSATGGSYSGDGGAASSANMYQPLGIALDTANNLLYIADSLNRVIRVVNLATNIINTFAGDYNYGDTRLAVNARLLYTQKMAVDSVNNLVYIADTGASIIRVVNRTSGIISRFAGTPGTAAASFSANGDGGLATSAKFSGPRGIDVDTVNNLVYVADTAIHVVRVINRATGIVSTFAGTGTYTGTPIGDGGAATSAILSYPNSVAVDTVNNLVYISEESGNRVRVVNRATNIISTFAGTGSAGNSGDNGPPSSAVLNSPEDVKVDTVNNLVYIADSLNSRIRVVNRTSNIIKTLVNGIGTGGFFTSVYGVGMDPINNLVYYTDATNNIVRTVCLYNTNFKSTFAGISGSAGYSGDYGDPQSAKLNKPVGVTVDTMNNLVYIVEYSNMVIRVVNRTSIPLCVTPTPTPTPTHVSTTSSPTTTQTPTPTPTPTDTSTTPTPTLTDTATPSPTSTSIPTTTQTPTDTPTQTPTDTSTPTPTPTSTTTPLPTSTTTPTATTTSTPTPTPTSTTTPSPTSTTTPTATPTPTFTTPTPTPTPMTTPTFTTITPTSSSTPTPTPQIQCFNVSASDANVCSGNGVCVSTDNCQCNSPRIIGLKCEINMQTSSTSYVVFDSSSSQSSIDIDAANDLPDSTGPVSYSFTSDNQLQLSSSSSDAGRKGICLKPSLLVAGLQTFIAFNFPTALPSGVAAEVWLQDTSADLHISSAIRFAGGSQSLQLTVDTTSSNAISLSTNTNYVLLMSVGSFGTDLSAQVVNLRNEVLSTVSTQIYDAEIANALSNDAFYVCISLANVGSRKAQASTNTTMNVMYFGSQTMGVSGTLSNQGTKMPSSGGVPVGTIVGAVVGSVLGCCLIIIVVTIIIFIIIAMRRKKVPVNNKTLRPTQVKTIDQEINLMETGHHRHEEQFEQPVEQPIELAHDHKIEVQDILLEEPVYETPIEAPLIEQPVEDVAELPIEEPVQPIEQPVEELPVEQPIEELVKSM